MNTYPLIRTRWSNEKIMAALFGLLILYHIPAWIKNSGEIINFILLTLAGLFLDAVICILRNKRLLCCVSAAVTAAIISLFSTGVPLWGQLLGLITALLLGKHVWGGTGKNRINPAMVGLLVILLFWNTPSVLFTSSYLLLPAAILSLLFLKLRPFAGIGFIVGAVAALLVNHDLSLLSVLSNGVLFWGCIVMTDPVTVTGRRLGGILAGSIAGFFAFFLYSDILIVIALVFTVNLFSYITDSFIPASKHRKIMMRVPKLKVDSNDPFLDLSENSENELRTEAVVSTLKPEEIISILRDNEVFGMGGAAFPSYKKISAVLSSSVQEKYLIINGAECDPGLLHDYYILRNYPEEIKKGIDILRSCIEFNSICLAVTDTKGLDIPKDISIHKLPDRYPIGAEKLLIREVLKQTLDKDQLPADRGILVLNVQTVYSVYKAIYLNRPADTRLMTVADLTKKTAKVVKVRLGMKLKDVMEASYPGTTACFSGGGIMQAHFAAEEETVGRSTNLIAVGVMPKFKESVQCSRCGYCVRNCPAGLAVNKIADLIDEGKIQETSKYNAEGCISCGSCSYSCLAGRNLAVKIKTAKDYVRKESGSIGVSPENKLEIDTNSGNMNDSIK